MLFSPELRNSSRCKLHQSTLILFLVVYDSPNPLQEKYERSRENARKRYKWKILMKGLWVGPCCKGRPYDEYTVTSKSTRYIEITEGIQACQTFKISLASTVKLVNSARQFQFAARGIFYFLWFSLLYQYILENSSCTIGAILPFAINANFIDCTFADTKVHRFWPKVLSSRIGFTQHYFVMQRQVALGESTTMDIGNSFEVPHVQDTQA